MNLENIYKVRKWTFIGEELCGRSEDKIEKSRKS